MPTRIFWADAGGCLREDGIEKAQSSAGFKTSGEMCNSAFLNDEAKGVEAFKELN
jgi:hypothetical protein